MGPQQTHALKTMCPNLERTVRSFIVKVQRGHGLLTDIFPMGGWWGKKESASSTFRFNWSGVYMLVGSLLWINLNFSHLEGLSISTKQTKDTVAFISWWGTKTLPKVALLFFLTVFPWVSHSLPSLISNWLSLEPMELREDRGDWMKAVSCNQRNGGHRKALCPRATQGPGRYRLLRVPLDFSPIRSLVVSASALIPTSNVSSLFFRLYPNLCFVNYKLALAICLYKD